jgi:hypothetical protein
MHVQFHERSLQAGFQMLYGPCITSCGLIISAACPRSFPLQPQGRRGGGGAVAFSFEMSRDTRDQTSLSNKNEKALSFLHRNLPSLIHLLIFNHINELFFFSFADTFVYISVTG